MAGAEHRGLVLDQGLPPVAYRVVGTEMHLAISRKALGLPAGKAAPPTGL